MFFTLFAALTPARADGLGLTTVVIDAGHGGKDPGSISRDKKTYEKTLTLDISRRLSEKISSAYPEVKVVMTRSKDEYVTLNDRAQIANSAHADLFISIHINDNDRTSPKGFSVHVLGQSSRKDRDLFAYNADVVRRENSVILLEEDYQTNYMGMDPSNPESYIFMMLKQNSHREQCLRFAEEVRSKLAGGPITNDRGISQDPFYVLWGTGMPAVLVELGFISNPDDLAVLRKESGREEIAERLFEAFRDYKEMYDASLRSSEERNGGESKDDGQPVERAPWEYPGNAGASAPPADPVGMGIQEEPPARYAVQILATKSLRNDPSLFLGYTPEVLQVGNLYKYYIAVSENLSHVRSCLPEIRKKYPDAFIVEIKGGEAVPLK